MKKIFSIAILSIFIFSSCQKEDEIEPLLAKVESEVSAQIGSTVTLDASASEGLDRASVLWVYNGGPVSEAEFTYDDQGNSIFDPTSATATFYPPKTGNYSFTLRLTSGSEFSEAYVNVVVGGNIELTDLSTSTTLEGINDMGGEGSDPDYVINSVLTIPQGTDIQLGAGVVIAFGPEAGIIVAGSLTGISNGNNSFESSGTSKWKGIWVKEGGSFSVPYITIVDAGSASLSTNIDEAAALLVDGTANLAIAAFKNSAGYGIYVGSTGNVTSESGSGLNFLNNTNTLRMPYHLMQNGKLSLSNLQLGDESATARIELYGVDGYTLQKTTQIYNVSRPIYVESDIEYNYTEALLAIQNAELRFAAGTGLIINGSCQLTDATFIGQTETAGFWKGIFLAYPYAGCSISSSTIKHGGSEAYATADGPAGLYSVAGLNAGNGSLSVNSCVISDNAGVGLISDGQLYSFANNSFNNNSLAHVRMNISELHRIGDGNSFSTGVTTIELQKKGAGVATNLVWKALGTDNYYLCKTNIDANTLTMEPGLHVKFDINRYLSVAQLLTVNGTASEPVLLEGTTGTPGDWVGVRLIANATVDYLTIKDGGRTGGEALFGTQNTANLFMTSPAGRTVNITNSTFSNSAGYGVLVKIGASPYTVNDAASNNSMSGTSGGFVDENL